MFIRTYFLKAAFLDGKQGLMLAISSAEVTYYNMLINGIEIGLRSKSSGYLYCVDNQNFHGDESN